jgi:hypothetical protein
MRWPCTRTRRNGSGTLTRASDTASIVAGSRTVQPGIDHLDGCLDQWRADTAILTARMMGTTPNAIITPMQSSVRTAGR